LVYFSAVAKNLISRLLVVNPRGRFKAIDVLCDPFILTVGGSLPSSEASDEVRQNVRSELDARAKQYRVSFKYPSSLKHG
jgi:serine/threonine protein kinase